MKKIIDYLLSSIYLVYFLLTILIFHPIQWVAFNIFGKKAHKVTVDYLNFFINFGLHLTGARITFDMRAKIPENRPLIVLANHQSMFDISGMTWFFRKYHPRFVSKIELAKGIPSISYNLRHGGSALINRKEGKKAIIEIAKLGALIQQEKTVAMIFPEGTRSASGIMKSFQPGGVATLLKKAPDALIIPMAITGTGQLNPKGYFPLRSFTALSWTALPAIEPQGKTLEEILSLSQDSIQRVLDEKKSKHNYSTLTPSV
ncbi:1-acyl-sn-glycerol-3-phosphate acyltransferase [Dyadobacter jejuensis]|uniref:1-acyl-sn-glycerol-3-phosphate acyltransferase n=1 Tax=Dyadobacter jejuensis TaxID=1082580 RepID=A0A316AKQ6_9BACT|nr:lysophospholipid acyltransferase family protein [Dyadobacter jejuensis]PWJ58353.1 1-acyl-sn-glycerol-3-phosphate acyltransferase [Dyadobacter jejuensis]